VAGIGGIGPNFDMLHMVNLYTQWIREGRFQDIQEIIR
jgi:hypothetical protein